VHPEFSIHHRFIAQPHRAGADRMEVARAEATNECLLLFPAHSFCWNDPALDQAAVRRLRGDFESQVDAGRQGVNVSPFCQEIGLDLQRAIGFCGP
jgi:hypothetical protein